MTLVALLTEGVGRNSVGQGAQGAGVMSPSSRRAWIKRILGIVGDQPGGLNLRKEPERMRIFVITYFVYGLIFIKHIKYIL